MAECCCEIKEAVAGVNATVLATVLATDTNRIRDDLATVRQQLLFAQLNDGRREGCGHRGGNGDGND